MKMRTSDSPNSTFSKPTWKLHSYKPGLPFLEKDEWHREKNQEPGDRSKNHRKVGLRLNQATSRIYPVWCETTDTCALPVFHVCKQKWLEQLSHRYPTTVSWGYYREIACVFRITGVQIKSSCIQGAVFQKLYLRSTSMSEPDLCDGILDFQLRL